jgi:hypothetical protein
MYSFSIYFFKDGGGSHTGGKGLKEKWVRTVGTYLRVGKHIVTPMR